MRPAAMTPEAQSAPSRATAALFELVALAEDPVADAVPDALPEAAVVVAPVALGAEPEVVAVEAGAVKFATSRVPQ